MRERACVYMHVYSPSCMHTPVCSFTPSHVFCHAVLRESGPIRRRSCSVRAPSPPLHLCNTTRIYTHILPHSIFVTLYAGTCKSTTSHRKSKCSRVKTTSKPPRSLRSTAATHWHASTWPSSWSMRRRRGQQSSSLDGRGSSTTQYAHLLLHCIFVTFYACTHRQGAGAGRSAAVACTSGA